MRTNFTWHDAQIVARLKPGVTLEHARQSMAALSLQVTAKDFRGPHAVITTPLRSRSRAKHNRADPAAERIGGAAVDRLRQSDESPASRGAARGREVAVRGALGAGRGRLVSQFLTESLVLAMLGTLAGLVVAIPAMRFLERLRAEAMDAASLTLDWRVLAFSAGRGDPNGVDLRTRARIARSRLAPLEGLRDGGRGTAGTAATGSSIR